MTQAVPILPANEPLPSADESAQSIGEPLPSEWAEIRADEDIQFAPVEQAERVPREPSWLDQALDALFAQLGELLGPVGTALAANWGVLRWVVIGIVALIVLYFALRTLGPLARRKADGSAQSDPTEPEWAPDASESRALLEDADKLAAEGRYDEAARLLLQRSVSQIATAKPDWVEPSSTARELAALPALSTAARSAFSVISEAVERSLFALHALNREDWERARGAYADFALSTIEAPSASGSAL